MSYSSATTATAGLTLAALSITCYVNSTFALQGQHSWLLRRGVGEALHLPQPSAQQFRQKFANRRRLLDRPFRKLIVNKQSTEETDVEDEIINGASVPSSLSHHVTSTTPDPDPSSSSASSSTGRQPLATIISKIRKPSSKKGESLVDAKTLEQLRRENAALREAVQQLESENERLHHEAAGMIILETFEGEGKLRKAAEERAHMSSKHSAVTLTGEEMLYATPTSSPEDDATLLWCDELEEGACPVEPTVSFSEALRDRAYWLVGLLILQSLSGIILARNEALLADHPVIVYFLTMLVGAGGNAGNQASVRVIRGLALGTLNEQTQNQFLFRELKMALSLSAILSTAGFIRAAVFQTPLAETLAVTSALALIVFSSICLGAILPLILKRLGVDPAHSSTTIQVIMDILGVVMAVLVSTIFLESPVGQMVVGILSKRFGG